MRALFFDTETTGLPKNYKAPVTDVDNWPRLVQLAWLLYDDNDNYVDGCNDIVCPDGWTVPEQAANLHGITTERALAEGHPVIDVLTRFENAMRQATHLVAHNMAFDERILGAEYVRAKWPRILPKLPRVCTMLSTTDICKLNGRYGYKWPKLQELHRHLFHDTFEEAHNAAADIKATARCFYELKRLNLITI